MTGLKLLENASATGAGQVWPGGRAVLVHHGTWGGATLAYQVLGLDGSTYVNVATATADGVTAVDLPPGTVRAALTGGTPSGIYAGAFGIRS